MAKIIISPGKYIQGENELKNMANHLKSLGKRFLILVSESGKDRVEKTIKESFHNSECVYEFEIFNGECSKDEINRIIESYKNNSCDGIVGIGGGKILDTAKAVAFYVKAPTIIVPTIASTDAPCSALSVIYTNDGVFSEYLMLPKNPDMVIVDTQIVVNAPSRLLVSGMGDALATYFEAKATYDANKTNMLGGQVTLGALSLAKLCYETLLEDGLKAKLAAENSVVTKALENIVEANTYLSGIGFESGGLAAAHAIHNGFTELSECHNLYHGEKVAFGTIVQLVLENKQLEEIEEVMDFCTSVGLPITLEDMGIEKINKEDIMKVAKAACKEGETIYNMPFKVTEKEVYSAILTTDSLGKEYKQF